MAGQSTVGQHIVVVGAGYAGLTAATGAGRLGRVTLVAPEARFLHRIRQHETAAGHPEQRPALARLVRGRQVTHVQARVTELDLTARKVFLDSGETLAYDTLVYALGSRTAWHGVPGAAEHAYPVERSAELRERLRGAERPGTVAVVGGGATGIELAAELAEAYPQWRVRIIAAGQVGGWFSAKGRAHVLRVLDRLAVQLHEYAPVTAVTPQGPRTDQGLIDAEVTVWAASMEPAGLAADAGLATAPDGRALVDDHLRSVSHPEVHVIGDAASVTLPGPGTLRMGCATAQPMGRYVGRLLSGRTAKPFAYRYVAQCLSLGRRDGLLQLIHGDDSMRPTALTGTTGRLAKALIVSGVMAGLR
ncbi:FAD-dependent oxidoreductase [Kitasatospora sp. MAP5-34]|uniref:NAD(P)/FAD-dependent oxidoreductase n=1 Tax=Kitasatospora sp. MAP5-34 TaxID=3035102 RepID=UPI0024745679|nr:FAD-dependent oxidoreductase [Kitasatospora sp. MAP5-34]MDH6574804.1 NADH dehydrogenase FAD-containing subunit [Kitasatospora sp. MAP5-34]